MQSIRRRLSIILIMCAVIAVLLSAFFVNSAINSTFNRYMTDIQMKRNTDLVDYFKQIYKRDKKWTVHSGEERLHEAYMSNYCLSLLDKNQNVVWQMNPNDISAKNHIMLNSNGAYGVYTTKTLDIDVDGKTVGYLVIGQYAPILLSEQDVNFKVAINRSIAISAILAIVVICVISLVFSKQFSSPIKAVADASVELSKGNYDSKLEVKGNIHEIRNLISSMNDLGNKLNSQDLLRKRLVSDISHEIRTPLNVLQNNLEAMIDGIKPVTEENLNSLNDEVIRFGKLLNNLNSLKEIETEEMKLHFETVDIVELVRTVCGDFKVAAEEKDIEIIFGQSEYKHLSVIGDMDKLKQVFINLISNSIKFTPEKGKVWVDFKADADRAEVEIRDNGIGIKKEDIPFIFERLYRGDRSRHQTEGAGLGLTIVKKILSMHNADIHVESKVNKGTKFTVTFNMKKVL